MSRERKISKELRRRLDSQVTLSAEDVEGMLAESGGGLTDLVMVGRLSRGRVAAWRYTTQSVRQYLAERRDNH